MAGSSSDMIKIAAQRIKRELRDAARSDELRNSGVKLELVGDSYLELLGEIGGPPDTPYEGGRFQLEIKVPDSYPFNAPKVHFINHVWHPNISSVTGAVCLDILKDQWAAAMTLRTVLLSLQALLCAPEPDDPQDAVVGQQCKNFPDLFQATARYWTRVYAGAKEGGPWEEKFEEFDTKIREMRMRGVEDVSARAILSGCNWDVAEAIERSFN